MTTLACREPLREIAGRYQLLEQIGEGGMGTVYRAFDALLEEPVALKLLRAGVMEQSTMVERFRREVKLARRVTHPNVARVYDLGADSGEHFITMELVEGKALSYLIDDEAPLPLERVVSLGRQICAGLEAAHRAGVVHRDLKPENILLSGTGAVAVTDFGVARALERDLFPAMTIGTLGTPHYMAPEQVALENTDERTDIYALGMVLFEMCTGTLPWDGTSVFLVAAARLRQPPPDPRTRALVDDDLAEIILRCLAREPEQRFPTAGAVEAALAAVVPPVVAAVSSPTPARPEALRTTASASVTVLASHDEPLARGFCSLLESALHGASRLLVRPAAPGPSHDVREAGRRLHTDAVAHVSLRPAGDSLRLILRLIDTKQGVTRHAVRLDVSPDTLVSAASEAASTIALGLGCEAPSPLPDGLQDLQAGRWYLEARHDQLQQTTEANDFAIAKLERALQRLPDDPFVLGAYAEALVRRLDEQQAFSGDAEEAREMATRALVHAPQLASARVALAGAFLELGDGVRAARELTRASAVRPSFPELHALLGRLLCLGVRLEAGEVELAHALDTGALLATLFDRAIALAYLGRPDEADALLSGRAADLGHSAPFWITRGRLALYRGDTELLKELLREANEHVGLARGEALAFLAPIAGAGSVARACATFHAAAEDSSASPRRRIVFIQVAAELAAAQGLDDAALSSIEQGVAAGLEDQAWLERCPLFTRLGGTLRFRNARQRVAERAERVLAALPSMTVPKTGDPTT